MHFSSTDSTSDLRELLKPADQVIRARAAINYVANYLVFATLLMGVQTFCVAAPGVIATVTRVIDGDTIWVQTSPSSKPLKVRIQSIDAPEICQNGGSAARAALKNKVLGKQVVLFAKATDHYSRAVAKVDFQGEDLGRLMVASGHAWSLGAFDSSGPYKLEQMNALAERRGLFSDAKAEHPKSFRKRYGSCYPGR